MMNLRTKQRFRGKTRCAGLTDLDIFKLFCLLGALAQIAYVLEKYFRFDYLTRAYVTVPENTKFPDVTVCFETVYALNFTKLFEKYPKIARSFGYSPGIQMTPDKMETLFDQFTQEGVLYDLGNQLTIRQFWELMYPQEVIIDSVKVRRVVNRKSQMEECKVKTVFREKVYCYSFACSQQTQVISYYQDLYREIKPPSLFTLALKQEFFRSIDSYYVTLVRRNSLPRGQRLKWETQEAFHDARDHKYFFYSLEVNYLPAPYPTNCRNYTAEGHASQIVMKELCQIKLALEKTGSPLSESMIDSPMDVPFGFVTFRNNQRNQTFLKIIADIVEYCDKMTRQPDCSYKAYMISSRTPLPISGNLTLVTIDQIKDPIARIIFEPKMTILDCIIMIGSVLGTWLGFSITYHIPKISKFCYQKACTCCNIGSGGRPSKLENPGKMDLGIISSEDSENIKSRYISKTMNDTGLKMRYLPPRKLPFYMYYDIPKQPIHYRFGNHSVRYR